MIQNFLHIKWKFLVNKTKKMKKIFSENTAKIGKNYKQWIIGNSIDKYPELMSDNVMIKWGKHKKGEKRKNFVCDKNMFTVTILVYGKMQQIFENKKLLQTKEGDLVYYAPGVYHKWIALEDSLIITIRSFNKIKTQ